MAIVFPNEGEAYFLNRFLKGTNGANNLTLKLYTAVAGGLVEGTVLANFTEASFPGYAAKTLTNSTWGNAVISTVTSSTYATQTWTCTGGGANQGCLGYYVVDLVAGVVVWAEPFAATENMVNNGDVINVPPYLEGA